jgi:hypothetical protein
MVRRILPLAHDALEAEAHALCQKGAGVGECLAESDHAARGARQHCLEAVPPLIKRMVAQIPPAGADVLNRIEELRAKVLPTLNKMAELKGEQAVLDRAWVIENVMKMLASLWVRKPLG